MIGLRLWKRNPLCFYLIISWPKYYTYKIALVALCIFLFLPCLFAFVEFVGLFFLPPTLCTVLFLLFCFLYLENVLLLRSPCLASSLPSPLCSNASSSLAQLKNSPFSPFQSCFFLLGHAPLPPCWQRSLGNSLQGSGGSGVPGCCRIRCSLEIKQSCALSLCWWLCPRCISFLLVLALVLAEPGRTGRKLNIPLGQKYNLIRGFL